jgi:hypothetical protein
MRRGGHVRFFEFRGDALGGRGLRISDQAGWVCRIINEHFLNVELFAKLACLITSVLDQQLHGPVLEGAKQTIQNS